MLFSFLVIKQWQNAQQLWNQRKKMKRFLAILVNTIQTNVKLGFMDGKPNDFRSWHWFRDLSFFSCATWVQVFTIIIGMMLNMTRQSLTMLRVDAHFCLRSKHSSWKQTRHHRLSLQEPASQGVGWLCGQLQVASHFSGATEMPLSEIMTPKISIQGEKHSTFSLVK